VLQEALGLIHLELDVVLARFRPQPDLLDLRVMNVCFVLLLLLLVLELAEIHDPADGRLFVGCHLDQIEPRLTREIERLFRGDDPELTPFGGDDSDRGDPNLIVDAMLLLDGSRLRSRNLRHREKSSRGLGTCQQRNFSYGAPGGNLAAEA
jgi:hypothetical protein